ncbi:hypothetical protein EVAR_9857_1 [Eumeta japonica]|uniref:Uncharacterized protein n=1 Tax=Eumeta variegata TaxID=151549 RepID=A0A4C1TQ92_EUMVA|nr:hypothetical protein EVAR_9857_1 [Eumeta japonica]
MRTGQLRFDTRNVVGEMGDEIGNVREYKKYKRLDALHINNTGGVVIDFDRERCSRSNRYQLGGSWRPLSPARWRHPDGLTSSLRSRANRLTSINGPGRRCSAISRVWLAHTVNDRSAAGMDIHFFFKMYSPFVSIDVNLNPVLAFDSVHGYTFDFDSYPIFNFDHRSVFNFDPSLDFDSDSGPILNSAPRFSFNSDSTIQ